MHKHFLIIPLLAIAQAWGQTNVNSKQLEAETTARIAGDAAKANVNASNVGANATAWRNAVGLGASQTPTWAGIVNTPISGASGSFTSLTSVGGTFSGHIVPSVTDVYDLGSNTLKFRDARLSGGLTAGSISSGSGGVTSTGSIFTGGRYSFPSDTTTGSKLIAASNLGMRLNGNDRLSFTPSRLQVTSGVGIGWVGNSTSVGAGANDAQLTYVSSGVIGAPSLSLSGSLTANGGTFNGQATFSGSGINKVVSINAGAGETAFVRADGLIASNAIGNIANSVGLNSGSLGVGTTGVIGFTNNNQFFGTVDATLSRNASGVVQIGTNGINANGSLALSGINASATISSGDHLRAGGGSAVQWSGRAEIRSSSNAAIEFRNGSNSANAHITAGNGTFTGAVNVTGQTELSATQDLATGNSAVTRDLMRGAYAELASDQTMTNNTSFVDINGLSLSLSAGTYELTSFVYVAPAAGNSTMGLKINFVATGTGTIFGINRYYNSNTFLCIPYSTSSIASFADARQTAGGVNAQPGINEHQCILKVTSGTTVVKAQFAQYTSDAGILSAKAGSYLRAVKIGN